MKDTFTWLSIGLIGISVIVFVLMTAFYHPDDKATISCLLVNIYLVLVAIWLRFI